MIARTSELNGTSEDAMNLSLLLSRIGIRPRIFGGFALILGFLTVVALLAVTRLGEIGGTVGDLVSSADGDSGMAQVNAALLSANTAVEKFIRTRNLGDRDSAKILGSAALQTLPGFDPAEAAAKLRHGGLQQAIGADIASGRMREVAGWVLPDSLVMAAALAAKA